jgi:hypothetical protein
MLKIYCSNKLSALIGNSLIDKTTNLFDSEFGQWNAHLFYLDSRKCVIAVNDVTFYALFFIDVLKKDLIDFQSHFKNRLTEQLIHDEIILDSKDKLIDILSENISFHKTNNNRVVLGVMNNYISNFKAYCFHRYSNVKEMNLTYENGLFNSTPQEIKLNGKKEWLNSKERIKLLIK